MIKLSLINGDTIKLSDSDSVSCKGVNYQEAANFDFQDLLQSENTLLGIVSKKTVYYVHSKSIVFVELTDSQTNTLKGLDRNKLGI